MPAGDDHVATCTPPGVSATADHELNSVERPEVATMISKKTLFVAALFGIAAAAGPGMLGLPFGASNSPAIAAAADAPAPGADLNQSAETPTPEFQATDASLNTYHTPAWFSQARFGIWAHWDASSVPGISNGFPRDMYLPGTPDYAWFVKHFGPQSKFGFKDVIRSWKAERFDPEALMEKFKAAGARYFVALASHHDNFDNFDSTYNPWNSVKEGPHRDIVGDWRKAAIKNGLRFGVSWHADQRGWSYYHGIPTADTTGPFAGVPYDLSDPANYSLYNPPHDPKAKPSADWLDRWTKRQIDLIDKYHPDLLYYDGGISFSNDGGRAVVAHFLNTNRADHNGVNEGVINTKNDNFTRDYERGLAYAIQPKPWQDDSSLGGWFFINDAIADRASKSKDTGTVIATIADAASKNGNVLMNMPMKGDGSLYLECEKVLADLAKWIPINGEAIFGTHAWLISHQGPTDLPSAKYMNELYHPMTWQDIRFTSRQGADGKTIVYAICLGIPQGPIVIPALGRLGPSVSNVELLGTPEKVSYKSDWNGLTINPLSKYPCDFAVVFKLTLND
jgi:alpha-L-fucosidase